MIGGSARTGIWKCSQILRADSFGCIVLVSMVRPEGSSGKWSAPFLAKLAKDSDRFQFEKLRPRGVFQSLLDDINRAVQLYEADLAAGVLNGRNRLVDKARVHGRFRREGEDGGDAILRRGLEDREPYLLAQRDEGWRAEGEDRQERVHNEVIVEQAKAGQVVQRTADGQLSSGGRSVDEDQFHGD